MNVLVDLYLAVKVRKESTIDILDRTKLLNEKKKLLGSKIDALTLVEYIRSSVEVLVDIQDAEAAVCSRCQRKMAGLRAKEYPEIPSLEEDENDKRLTKPPSKKNPQHQSVIQFPDSVNSSKNEMNTSLSQIPQQYEDLLVQYEECIRVHIQQECT